MTASPDNTSPSLHPTPPPPVSDARSGKFFLGIVLGAVLCAVCFFGAGFGGAIGMLIYTIHSESKSKTAVAEKMPDIDKPIEKEEKKMAEPIQKAYKSEDSYKDLFNSNSGLSDLIGIHPKPGQTPLKRGGESAKKEDGKETDAATDALATEKPESPESSPILPPVWVNARSKIRLGDVEIAISRIHIGIVEIGKDEAGKPKMSDEAKLQIRVTVANLNQKKKLDFQSWQEGGLGLDRATLADNFDNSYDQILPETGNTLDNFSITKKSLYPNKPVADDLIFETPLENITFLNLELPAENIGGSGSIRFEIPADMITK